MSYKTKRIAKGLGASALAVATIASGLSFGAAASANPSSAPQEAKDGRTVQIIAKLDEYNFRTHSASYVRQFPTYADAQKAATSYRVLPTGDGRFQLEDTKNPGQCWGYAKHASLGEWFQEHPCGGPQSELMQDERGNIMVPAYSKYLTTNIRSMTNQSYFAPSTSAPSTNDFVGIEGLGFGGRVVSTDLDRRSAVVSGAAIPNAFVAIAWGDGRADEIRANADGEWSYELEGLQLGENPVHIEQYVDKKQYGFHDFDVELKIADLTVEHEFGAERDDLVVLSGAAQPGAVVQALDENGNMLVASDEVPMSGAWSMELPAPNKAGAYEIDVVQSYGGEQTGKTAVSIDYGAQLAVTRPEDGFAHAGGKLKLRGTGEPSSTITVAEDGKVVGTANVFQSSQWNLTTTEALSASEHELTVTQQSKGGNAQTETIVVNPGEGTVELTADGRFDAADATKPATAFGAAPNGSTVVLRNSVGTEIGRTVAKGDAYEIKIDPTKAISGVNSFSVIIDGAPESESKSFTLNYGQPAAAVVVTKPERDGTVAPGRVEFAGTGETGSKIVVRGSSREVASAMVVSGSWSATSTMELGKGKYDLYFDQISKGGLTSTVRHAFTIGELASIVTPHTLTSPGADAVLDTLTPEFRGTGHEGATITVRGSSRVVASGTVVNGQWIAKTDEASPLAPGTYNLYVDQSVRGTVTGTIRASFTVSNESFRELTLSAPAQNENVTTLRPTFVGTATPGAEIRVGSSRTTVATATVGDDGTWRATALFDLARGGTYAGLEVKQTTKSGKTSTTSSSFTVDRNAQ
ncbi:Ig-like domain-containing protein [Curtobacterium sp. NPDC089689]|uniref:Ig-like domain-containing protein n=1 Tax=Curtobacterium sp. NPDC089689 TaxID=3363968 RepID=UPI00381F04C3